MRDTRAKEAAALARLNQNYGFLLVGSTQGMHLMSFLNRVSMSLVGCQYLSSRQPSLMLMIRILSCRYPCYSCCIVFLQRPNLRLIGFIR